jgi:hypothetical protein
MTRRVSLYPDARIKWAVLCRALRVSVSTVACDVKPREGVVSYTPRGDVGADSDDKGLGGITG